MTPRPKKRLASRKIAGPDGPEDRHDPTARASTDVNRVVDRRRERIDTEEMERGTRPADICYEPDVVRRGEEFGKEIRRGSAARKLQASPSTSEASPKRTEPSWWQTWRQ